EARVPSAFCPRKKEARDAWPSGGELRASRPSRGASAAGRRVRCAITLRRSGIVVYWTVVLFAVRRNEKTSSLERFTADHRKEVLTSVIKVFYSMRRFQILPLSSSLSNSIKAE